MTPFWRGLGELWFGGGQGRAGAAGGEQWDRLMPRHQGSSGFRREPAVVRRMRQNGPGSFCEESQGRGRDPSQEDGTACSSDQGKKPAAPRGCRLWKPPLRNVKKEVDRNTLGYYPLMLMTNPHRSNDDESWGALQLSLDRATLCPLINRSILRALWWDAREGSRGLFVPLLNHRPQPSRGCVWPPRSLPRSSLGFCSSSSSTHHEHRFGLTVPCVMFPGICLGRQEVVAPHTLNLAEVTPGSWGTWPPRGP